MAKRRAATKRQSLNRNIFFYRIDAGDDARGRPRTFDVKATLDHIHSLPFEDDGPRYQLVEDDNAICCWIDDSSSTGRLRIGAVRRTGLPQVDRSGVLTDLNIPLSAGLVEQVHVVFFPNRIVGSEFNFHGPRLSRLSSYFSDKARGIVPPVVFEPLIRRDVTEQLDRLTDVRLFQLRIRKSYAEGIVRIDDSLGAAFQAAAQVSDADEIEITLSPKRFSRNGIGQKMIRIAKSLIGLRGIHEESQKFHVKGFDPQSQKTELVDLLSDKLIVRKQIIRHGERSRALDSASAYSAIESAYNEVREELEILRGVSS